jgi:hypothetical protein
MANNDADQIVMKMSVEAAKQQGTDPNEAARNAAMLESLKYTLPPVYY